MAEKTVHQVSLATTAAAIVALGALYIIAPHQVGLIVVAVLLVGSHVFNRRLPNMPLLIWTIRFALYMVLILTSGVEDRGLRRLYLKPEYSNLFGYLCAVELAIQYWKYRDRRPARGEALVLSGLIFAVATNTPDPQYIRWLAPLFMGLVVLSLRGFRPRRPAIERAGTRWSVRAIRLAAVGCSFGFAVVMIGGIKLYGHIVDNLTFAPLLSKAPNTSTTGVSTEPTLGRSHNMQGSPQRVMRIDGLTGEAHLRGLSFDTYSQNRWSPKYEELDFGMASRSVLNATAAGKRCTFTRWLDSLGILYLPLNCAGIAPVSSAQAMWEDNTRSTRAGFRVEPDYVYEAVIATPTHQGPLCPPITEEQRKRCLDVPADIKREVVELARQTIAGITDPAKKAAAIAKFVEGNNEYSLEIDPPPGDRISDFIMNKRPGHCQYFASAAVMMLRSAGIPARYVVGYYAHEPAGDSSVIVRQRDAHAWAEAWIDGTGWITLDATPAAARPDEAFPPISFWRKTWEWIVDVAAAFAEWAGGLTMAMFLTGIAILIGAIILIQWLRILLKRRRKKGTSLNMDAYEGPGADLAAIAAGFGTILRRHDIGCSPTTTWAQHVSALEKAPVSVDDLRQFVAVYTHVRFRRQEDAESIDELRGLLGRLDNATPARST